MVVLDGEAGRQAAVGGIVLDAALATAVVRVAAGWELPRLEPGGDMYALRLAVRGRRADGLRLRVGKPCLLLELAPGASFANNVVRAEAVTRGPARCVRDFGPCILSEPTVGRVAVAVDRVHVVTPPEAVWVVDACLPALSGLHVPSRVALPDVDARNTPDIVLVRACGLKLLKEAPLHRGALPQR